MARTTAKPAVAAATTMLVAVTIPEKAARTAKPAKWSTELLAAACEMLKTTSVSLDGNVPQDSKQTARRLASIARRAVIAHGSLDPKSVAARVFSTDDGATWTYGITMSTAPVAVAAA